MALRLGAHIMSLHDQLLYEPLSRQVRCSLDDGVRLERPLTLCSSPADQERF